MVEAAVEAPLSRVAPVAVDDGEVYKAQSLLRADTTERFVTVEHAVVTVTQTHCDRGWCTRFTFAGGGGGGRE